MSFVALSGLSQKFGSAIAALRRSRSADLVATSKRVPELGETGGHFVGLTPQFGIHENAPVTRSANSIQTLLYRKRFAETRSKDFTARHRIAIPARCRRGISRK